MLLNQPRPDADRGWSRSVPGEGQQQVVQVGDTGAIDVTALVAVQEGVVDQMKQLSAIRMVLEMLLVPRHGA